MNKHKAVLQRLQKRRILVRHSQRFQHISTNIIITNNIRMFNRMQIAKQIGVDCYSEIYSYRTILSHVKLWHQTTFKIMTNKN